MSDFKTVYPGQYSPREEKILDVTRKKLQEQIGKPTMFPVTPADPTLMRLHHCHSLLEGAGRHVPHAAYGFW